MPILQGKQSTGANSIAIKNKKTFIVVGGDFNTPDSTLKNCVITLTRAKRGRHLLFRRMDTEVVLNI